jgi:hypothetical protein
MEFRGQLSVEFLVILGVIMTVALVAIGLTLFFTQSSWEVSQSEINAYWSTQAAPIRVVEMKGYYYSGDPDLGELAMILENVDSKPITIKSLVLSPAESSYNVYSTHSASGSTGTLLGTSGSSALTGLDVELAPSEKTTVYIRTASVCTTGTAYTSTTLESFRSNLIIYYDTSYFTGLSFEGAKPVGGKCNPS